MVSTISVQMAKDNGGNGEEDKGIQSSVCS